jgi:hypothetical protein
MSFVLDSQSENWLTARGVPFKYVQNVPFSDLVPNWSTINQGRPDGASRDEELIYKYAEAMSSKAMFPAPMIARAADGYEILDGIQRLSAAALNDQHYFNAYIIQSDNPSVRASIRVCSNSVLNGTSPSQDWTISRIVDILYEHHKLSPIECHLWSGQPVKKIDAEIKAREGAYWMEHNGIDISMKPANQRGFRAAFSVLAPAVQRERVKKPLVTVIKSIQGMRANNDEAIGLLEECLAVKWDQRKDMATQVAEKFEEVMSRPEIKGRLIGKRKLHPVENICRALAGAVSTLREAVEEKHHADKKQAVTIVNLLVEAKALARKVVPKDEWGELAFGPTRN